MVRRTIMATVQESIDVAVPVSTAYNQWTQFESFPRFMEGVESVTQVDDTHNHWKTKIGGVEKEFDTEITDQRPDERIAWRSTGGVNQAGLVTFDKVDAGHTRVNVQFEWDPETFKEKVGSVVGMDNRQVHQDLERFKEFIEGRGGETGAWREEVTTEGKHTGGVAAPAAAGTTEPGTTDTGTTPGGATAGTGNFDTEVDTATTSEPTFPEGDAGTTGVRSEFGSTTYGSRENYEEGIRNDGTDVGTPADVTYPTSAAGTGLGAGAAGLGSEGTRYENRDTIDRRDEDTYADNPERSPEKSGLKDPMQDAAPEDVAARGGEYPMDQDSVLREDVPDSELLEGKDRGGRSGGLGSTMGAALGGVAGGGSSRAADADRDEGSNRTEGVDVGKRGEGPETGDPKFGGDQNLGDAATGYPETGNPEADEAARRDRAVNDPAADDPIRGETTLRDSRRSDGVLDERGEERPGNI
jgi:carbon monoxide dehydrogenase subunit G